MTPMTAATITLQVVRNPSPPSVPAQIVVEPPSKGMSTKALIGIGICLGVIVVAIAALAISHRSTSTITTTTSSTTTTTTTESPPSTATPAAQAVAFTQLLRSGPQDRSDLQNAIDVVQQSVDGGGGCSAGVPGAVAEIQSVASARAASLSQLSSVSLSTISGGGLVLSNLKSAWAFSGRIDRAFEQWASIEEHNYCSLSDSSVASYRTTETLDPISTAIKIRFVNRWDPIARRLGQPSDWSASEI
jgi:hypothetical protein